MGKEVGVFLPDRLFGLQGLEVLRQPRAVEPPVAQIGDHVRRPGSARERAEHPHRAGGRVARPITERRAVQHDGPGQTVAIGGQQGGGPTGLTIAVEHGCRVRVTAGDFGA